MNLAMINIVLIVLGILCIGIGTIAGFLRGLFKTTMKLGRIIVASLLAWPLTLLITSIMGKNAVALGSALLNVFGIDLESESPNLAAASGSLLSAVSAVFVYFAVVVILMLIFLLVFACLKKQFAALEEKCKIQPTASHGFGFLVGLFAGFLLFSVLTLPIVSISHTANDVAQTLQSVQSCPIDADSMELAVESTDSVMRFPLCRLSWGFPQKTLYKQITTVKTERGKGVLEEELHVAALMADDVFLLTNSTLTQFGTQQAEAVIHMASSLGDTKMMPSLLAGFLSDASTKWLADNTYFGMAAPHANAAAAAVMKGAYLLFSTTTPDTIEQDLLTFAEMLTSLDEVGLLDAKIDEQSILNKVSDGSFFDTILFGTDGTRSQIINDGLLDAVIEMICKKIGYTASVEEARLRLDKFTAEISDLLIKTEGMTRDERQAFLTDKVCALGTELGFQIPEKNAEEVTAQLLDRYGEQAPESLSLTDFLSVMAAAAPAFGLD